MTQHKNRILTSSSPDQTAAFGGALGSVLQRSTLLGLVGSLGAGKTNLTQGIGEAIGIARTDVTSPTFTICVPHYGRVKLLHLDAYRIKDGSEVDELGIDEELEEGSVIVVEWAELIEEFLPQFDVMVTLQATDEHQRRIEFEARTEKGRRLIEALPDVG